MSDIRITKMVAISLMKTAAELFAAGAGSPLDINENEDAIQGDGLIDEINSENSELFYWANELLRFARTVHGILGNAIHSQDEGTEVT